MENFITESEYEEVSGKAVGALKALKEKTGKGSGFTGFLTFPENYDRDEIQRIKDASRRIHEESEALVVIGIGGSYLGAKALTELMGDMSTIEIYFAGCSIDPGYLKDIMDRVKYMDFSVNVISKSGTTTEPAIAFRFFRDLLYRKYGKEEGDRRIYCTTDRAKGTLHDEAVENGWETFTVPDDIGGRYSVLTSVGLLPAAVAGLDIDELLEGAREGEREWLSEDFGSNDALRYAATRYILGCKGMEIEAMASFDPAFEQMEKWWKQLVAESEGKDGKGLFPTGLIYSTDLHSIGQMLQDGKRNFFETVISFRIPDKDIAVDHEDDDRDGINYLSGMLLSDICDKARKATALAHIEGGVPNILIECERKCERDIGKLIYFFEVAVAVTGYLIDVNPFDQPGVESYKQNMFALLGKKGYDDIREKLLGAK